MRGWSHASGRLDHVNEPPAVEATALERTYASGHTAVAALAGVTLRIRRGEFVAVMGPSGGGKSTLLNLVAGLDTPSEGEIVVAGDSLAGKAPGVLSGGQRQRLAIARALANQPTLLLADEPTGALDSAGGAEVMELFRRLHRDGQSILLVTHDDEVAEAADRIVEMRDGKVLDGREPEPVGASKEALYGGPIMTPRAEGE